jgi:integrase
MTIIGTTDTGVAALLTRADLLDVEGVLSSAMIALEPSVKLGRRAKGYRLVRRPARGPGAEAMIYMKGPGIKQISTGCTDEAGAKRFMSNYILQQEATSRGHVFPRMVPLVAVVEFAIKQFQPLKGASNGAFKRYRDMMFELEMLLAFGKGTKLGDITSKWCRDYSAWRQHDAKNFGGPPPMPFRRRPVTLSTIHRDLVSLDKAIGAFAIEYQLSWRPILTIPQKGKGRIRWLDKSELLRVIGAIHGRVWDHQTNGWLKEPYLNPVTGRSTTRLVLRDEDERHRRRVIGYPLFVFGTVTGTRITALCNQRWSPSDDFGWIDLERGNLHRAGFATDPEQGKPQTCTEIPRFLLKRLRRWHERDQTCGATHLIHKEDGSPYRTTPKKTWHAIVADAGLGDDVTFHVMRHTCCTMLLALGYSVDDAAEYVGLHPATFRRTYGHPTGSGAARVARGLDRTGTLGNLPDRNHDDGDERTQDAPIPRKQKPRARVRKPMSSTTRAKIGGAMKGIHARRRAARH